MEMVVPNSGSIHAGYIHGAVVDVGVEIGEEEIAGDDVTGGVAAALADGDGELVAVEGGVAPDVTAEVVVADAEGVEDGVDAGVGATQSVPGAYGFSEQLTLIVTANAHVGDSTADCVMYVAPPPTVEHANVSVVARRWPASVVEQPAEKSPPVYDCDVRRNPLGQAAEAAHEFQPAYMPVEIASLPALVCSTRENGHTSMPVDTPSL